MCMGVLPSFMIVQCVCGVAGGDQTRMLHSLNLELQQVVSHYVGAACLEEQQVLSVVSAAPSFFYMQTVCHDAHVEAREQLVEILCFHHMGPGIELRISKVASTCTHRTISLALVFSFNLSCCLLYFVLFCWPFTYFIIYLGSEIYDYALLYLEYQELFFTVSFNFHYKYHYFSAQYPTHAFQIWYSSIVYMCFYLPVLYHPFINVQQFATISLTVIIVYIMQQKET